MSAPYAYDQEPVKLSPLRMALSMSSESRAARGASSRTVTAASMVKVFPRASLSRMSLNASAACAPSRGATFCAAPVRV